ncbi:hypothetical protein IWX90DRAFT_78625 [Phyllosticta citrichinensis]|uniref:Uncharacterized protein n=1 Tax=Phyllosticta citrichinensis TaxID=1130410 RepID=A0ABR1XGV5_9PEZI
MKFLPAAEAGWDFSDNSNPNELDFDKGTRYTAAYIHFFRFNSLPPSSVQAIARPGINQLSHEYKLHAKHCERLAKRLRKKMWGLPAEGTIIEDWPFLPKFVLGLVTVYNSRVVLQNLRRQYIMAAQTPDEGSALETVARMDRQRWIEERFEQQKKQAVTSLSKSIQDLMNSGGAAGADPALRTEQEKLPLQKELNRFQFLLKMREDGNLDESNRIDEVTGEAPQSGVVPAPTLFYSELSPSQRIKKWRNLFDLDFAASIYWAVKISNNVC